MVSTSVRLYGAAVAARMDSRYKAGAVARARELWAVLAGIRALDEQIEAGPYTAKLYQRRGWHFRRALKIADQLTGQWKLAAGERAGGEPRYGVELDDSGEFHSI